MAAHFAICAGDGLNFPSGACSDALATRGQTLRRFWAKSASVSTRCHPWRESLTRSYERDRPTKCGAAWIPHQQIYQSEAQNQARQRGEVTKREPQRKATGVRITQRARARAIENILAPTVHHSTCQGDDGQHQARRPVGEGPSRRHVRFTSAFLLTFPRSYNLVI